MKKQTKIIMLLGLLAAYAAFLFQLMRTDRLSLYCNVESVSASLTAQADGSFVIDTESASAGEILSAPFYARSPGDYMIRIRYSADAPGNILQLYTTDYPAGKGESILASYDLPVNAEQETLELPFASGQYYRNIYLRILYGGKGTLHYFRTSYDSRGFYYHDALFMTLLPVFAGILLYILQKKEKAVLFCTAAGLFSSLPLFTDFLPFSHDLDFHLQRLESLRQGLLSGQFPVRMNGIFLNHTGYPVSIMYPDLFLYIPGFLLLAGVSIHTAYIFFIALINCAAACLAYISFRRILREEHTALAAMLFYVFSLYRFNDLYTRAALGELLAMTFLPLVLAGIHDLLWGDPDGWKYWFIGMTGILQSHVISTMIMGCVTGIFLLWALLESPALSFQKKRLVSWCKAIFSLIFLNLSFLVPFLQFYGIHMKVDENVAEMERSAVYPVQLGMWLAESTGDNAPTGNTAHEMPVGIGLLLFCSLLAFTWYSFRRNRKQTEEQSLFFRGSALCGMICLYASSIYFPWKYIQKVPVLGKILYSVEFPWRYLTPATLIACPACAILFRAFFCRFTRDSRIPLTAALIASILSVMPYTDNYILEHDVFAPDKYQYTYKENQGLDPTWTVGEYHYADLDLHRLLDEQTVLQLPEGLRAGSLRQTGIGLECDLLGEKTSGASGVLSLPLVYYPGYRITLDGKVLPAFQGENHILCCSLPAGAENGHLQVTYKGLALWHVCDGISLAAACMLLFMTASPLRRRNRSPRRKLQ